MIRSLPLLALPVVAVALFAVRLRSRFIRYEISGDSMLPVLADGDYVIVDTRSGGQPRPGDIVLARDPRELDRTLVKRVSRIEPVGVWLLGDNPDASTDSRTFGPVPLDDVLGQVRWRYWPLRLRLQPRRS